MYGSRVASLGTHYHLIAFKVAIAIKTGEPFFPPDLDTKARLPLAFSASERKGLVGFHIPTAVSIEIYGPKLSYRLESVLVWYLTCWVKLWSITPVFYLRILTHGLVGFGSKKYPTTTHTEYHNSLRGEGTALRWSSNPPSLLFDRLSSSHACNFDLLNQVYMVQWPRV